MDDDVAGDQRLVGQVEVFGLSGARDLNGQIGLVVRFDGAAQRYEVLFESRVTKLVKEENLRMVLSVDRSSSLAFVVLFAAHLHDEGDMNALEVSLRSVRQQQSPADLFLLGWSADTPDLRARTAECLRLWRETALLLHDGVPTEDAPSTFECFEQLLDDPRMRSLCADGRTVWVVFAELGDLWHPQRISAYRDAIEREATPDDWDIRASLRAQLCGGAASPAQSLADAERLLQEGWATRLEPEDEGAVEIFDFAFRSCVLVEFLAFASTRKGLLAHARCDRALLRFVRLREGSALFFDPTCWMYFRNRSMEEYSEPGVSTDARYLQHLQPSARDALIAEQAMEAKLLKPLPGGVAARDVLCARFNLELSLIDDHLGGKITSARVVQLAESLSRDMQQSNGCVAHAGLLATIARESCEAFDINEEA